MRYIDVSHLQQGYRKAKRSGCIVNNLYKAVDDAIDALTPIEASRISQPIEHVAECIKACRKQAKHYERRVMHIPRNVMSIITQAHA
jgi:hypothetical protein